MTTAKRPLRIGLRAAAIALITLLVLTFSTGRASAYSSCSPHGDGNDPARAFVCNLYFNFLHFPSDGEVAYWISVLSTSDTHTVANAIIGSQEDAATWVGYTYGDLLDRGGDPAGVHFWTDALQAGATYEDVQVALASSPEAFAVAGGTNDAYADYLYNAILDRTGSSDEIAYWSGVITSGAMSRATVANAFVHSDEYAEMVTGFLYGAMLHRDPDAAGLAYWSSHIQAVGVRQTYIDFLSTPEAYSVLSSAVVI